jgi:hypothetical protein
VWVGWVGMVRGEAEAAPGFGDDDAVGGVVEVVADLDGQVGADVADVVGERGDVLGALVGDASDAVIVDEQTRGVGGVVKGEGRVGDGSVGDAAHGGEKVTALSLDLFRGGLFTGEYVGGHCCRSGAGYCDYGYASWRP